MSSGYWMVQCAPISRAAGGHGLGGGDWTFTLLVFAKRDVTGKEVVSLASPQPWPWEQDSSLRPAGIRSKQYQCDSNGLPTYPHNDCPQPRHHPSTDCSTYTVERTRDAAPPWPHAPHRAPSRAP